MLDALLGHPLTHRLGWTLLHSLWQGLALACLFGLGLLLLEPNRNQLRHTLSTLVLLLWLAAPAATFTMLTPPTAAAGFAAGSEGAVTPPRQPTHVSQPKEPVSGVATEERTVVDAASPAMVLELQRLLPYAALAWLAVAALMSLRLLGGLIVTQRLAKAGTPLPTLEASLRTLAERLGIRRRVRLLASTRVDVPTALGWLRPAVLLPTSAITGLTTTQLELILTHELAHIRRHDHLTSLLQGVTEALLFYHPLTWWLSHTLRVEREHACDDLALRTTGAAPLALAESLARLEVSRAAPAPALAATTNLLPRIRRLLGGDRTTRTRTPALPPLLALAPLFLWLALTAQAATPASGLYQRHANGAIANPYSEAPEGGWETFHSLSEISSRAAYPLKAATTLPAGFRFSNATWDDRMQIASLTYAAASDGEPTNPFTRYLTLMQMPASEYRPLPVGLNADIQPVTIGAASGEYVTGHWAGDWNAPIAERDLHWQPNLGQLLAWQQDGIAYIIGTDQIPKPQDQPLHRDELLQVARGLVTINSDPEPPSSTLQLPTDKTRLWATLLGEISFSPDYSAPATIGEGGSMIIEERSPTRARRVIVTTTDEESFHYQYTENGAPAPFQDEAQAWYRATIEATALAPLRALQFDEHAPNYRSFKHHDDRYLSLIGLQEKRTYRLDLPGPLDPLPPHQLVSALELLTHGAAHGVINQGILEVALYAYLAETDLNPEQNAAFRYAAAQLASEPTRQRLLDRLD